jgi:hypothetical protein
VLRNGSWTKNVKEEIEKLGLFYTWQSQAEIDINLFCFAELIGIQATKCTAIYIAPHVCIYIFNEQHFMA